MKISDKIFSQLSRITEKHSNYAMGGVLLVIFLVDYFLVMQPQLRTLMKLTPKISMLTKDIAQAKMDFTHIDKYKKDILQLKEKLEMKGHQILSKDEIPLILDNVSRIAHDAKIQINQLMPLSESQKLVQKIDDAKYYSLPILMMGQGGYHDIGRFFNRMESDKIFMGIKDFDLNANDEYNRPHSFKLTVEVYVIDKVEEWEKKANASGEKK